MIRAQNSGVYRQVYTCFQAAILSNIMLINNSITNKTFLYSLLLKRFHVYIVSNQLHYNCCHSDTHEFSFPLPAHVRFL